MNPLPDILPAPPASILLTGAPSIGQSFIAREIAGAATRDGGTVVFVVENESDVREAKRDFVKWQGLQPGPHFGSVSAVIDPFRMAQGGSPGLVRSCMDFMNDLAEIPGRLVVVRDYSQSNSLALNAPWFAFSSEIADEIGCVCLTVIAAKHGEMPEAQFNHVWSLAEGFTYSDGAPREHINFEVTLRRPAGKPALHFRSKNHPGFQTFEAITDERLAS